MPRLILSTCGTSLLTNGADPSLRQLLVRVANGRTRDLDPSDRQAVDSRVEVCRQRLLQAGPSQARSLSAELNSLLRLYESRAGSAQGSPQKDMHYLLHTDTHQGRRSAEVLQEWLEANGFVVQLVTFSGLDTSSLESFRDAMSYVIRWCAETVGHYRGWHVVFNLTGGFKALNGFMQALGMFYADECVCLFESSAEVLTIPRLPVRLDPEGVVESNLHLFRRLALQDRVGAEEAAAIPQTLVCELEGQVALSTWGELVWERCRGSLYEQRLMEPVGTRLVLSPQFAQEVSQLSPGRRRLVNERLDQLWIHLGGRSERSLRSLDFKTLKGNPSPPSTHECDAWHDLDARRIFGHFVSGGVFQVDRLAHHL